MIKEERAIALYIGIDRYQASTVSALPRNQSQELKATIFIKGVWERSMVQTSVKVYYQGCAKLPVVHYIKEVACSLNSILNCIINFLLTSQWQTIWWIHT